MPNISLSKERTIVYTSLLLTAIVLIYLAFTANGTGDWGDAIFHYLFSRYAFLHPENFLNHWAKPIFVLFTAPIAQGGFTAMKLFNIATLLGTIWLTWQVGKQLSIPNSWFAIFPIITAPMSSYQTLSGLTEPMFACWMMLGIYWLVKEKYLLAIIWLSFLPFVRSEGLIVFCVLTLYLLFKKKWYLLPILATGHIVYGIIGHFYYKDFLWIFNKMPYATLNGAYGSGPFWHFAEKMHTVIGDFQPVLLVIGLIVGLVNLIQYWRGRQVFSKEKLWLVYGVAVAFFLAHSIFWYFGIFNSFGLLRVMIGVIPLFALIILEGINGILSLFPPNWQRFSNRFLVALILTFFIYLNKKLEYQFHFFQNAAQEGQNQLVSEYVDKNGGYTYYFDAIHLALPLEADWFDPMIHRTTPQLFTGEPIPSNSLIIWDNIFTERERKIPLEQLMQDKRFQLIDCKETGTWENPKPKSCLFQFDSTFANAHVLLDNGFEAPDYPKDKRDSTFIKEGQYSRRLNQQHPYSDTFSGWLTSFQSLNARLQISCWVYLPEGQPPLHSVPQMIISFESNNQPFEYYSTPLIEKNDEQGTWKYVTLEKTIPTAKMFNDQAKAYLWNPNETTIFIDDLKVEWNRD